MADYINRGRRYALGLAVLATRVRHRDFPDDPSGWLTWARDSFGYERRFCFQLLSVGNLLMSVHHDALIKTDLMKLESLARIPSHQLPALLERWDPSTATREEVRQKVAMWNPEEPEETDADAEAKAKRRPQRERPSSAAEAIELLASTCGMDAEGPRRLGAEIDPMVAIRAGFGALSAAIWHLKDHPELALTDAQEAALDRFLSAVLAEVAQIKARNAGK
jgi:hypothetical protein